jgi:hypothetical protein
MPEITVIYITIPAGKRFGVNVSVVGLTNYVKEVPFFVTMDLAFRTPDTKGEMRRLPPVLVRRGDHTQFV